MSATDMTVATTILEQLGGNKFRAMTGAKNFLAGPNELSFKLPGAGFCKDGINYVKVTLGSSDTYRMVFSRVRGSKVTTVAEFDDVYDDMLRPVFERATGLRTSL